MELADIGLTIEEVQDRVVDRLCERLVSQLVPDEDGDFLDRSPIGKCLDRLVRERIDSTVNDMAQKHVLPRVSEMIESLTLQATNQWGEAKGQRLTFREYMSQRAQDYMVEKVNFDGKTKAESGGYSWTAAQTRLAWMIDKHLQYTIKNGAEAALKIANDQLAQSITETVKIRMVEIASALKVSATVKT